MLINCFILVVFDFLHENMDQEIYLTSICGLVSLTFSIMIIIESNACTIDILVLIHNHIITLQLVQYELPTHLYIMTYYIITSLHHV